MTLNDIETAIGQRLEGMTGAPPIAWPNEDFTPDGPYVEFRHSPNTVEDPVINGGYEYELGIFVLTAVVPAGGFSISANQIAESIRQRFPKALRISSASGTVVINAPPRFGSPFQDGTSWRQPVTVSYITE